MEKKIEIKLKACRECYFYKNEGIFSHQEILNEIDHIKKYIKEYQFEAKQWEEVIIEKKEQLNWVENVFNDNHTCHAHFDPITGCLKYKDKKQEDCQYLNPFGTCNFFIDKNSI